MNLHRMLLILCTSIALNLCTSGGITDGSVTKKDQKHNRLVQEKSPYLLQHAEDPVAWYPWGTEAFEASRKENKPIFLSIGYSSCHFCHLMGRESFADPNVARLLNQLFVSILVDREERPDIDAIYSNVLQMMTGTGGWPLNVIMTPDRKPFFASTYLPREDEPGRAGMISLLPKMHRMWKEQREKVVQSANQITEILSNRSKVSSGKSLGEQQLRAASNELSKQYDSRYGGFGAPPKFPSVHDHLFLLRQWKRSGNHKMLQMVEKTLLAMRRGGMYDHIGYGFHRYSEDARWVLPHFEKMLYDQALMSLLYIEAYQATGKIDYAKTAKEVLSYVLRDMTGPEGGFYSSENSESERTEGKFYLWKQQEIEEVFGETEAKWFIRIFNIEKNGNFHSQSSANETGQNILHMNLNVPEAGFENRFQKARELMFQTRVRRTHPSKDDKILLDWNGLMIGALARAGQVLDDTNYIDAAKRGAAFLQKNFARPDGKLLHRYRDGETAVPAFLDDYAFFIWGLMELYEATFDSKYLKLALEFNEYLLQNFWDDKDGGFFLTSDEVDPTLIRYKKGYDGSIPSGNSIAMLNLLRLGRITGNQEFETKAAKIGSGFSKVMEEAPAGFTQMLSAVDFMIGPSYEIVIAGNSKSDDTKAFIRSLRKGFIPNKVVVLRPTEQQSPEILAIANFAKYYSSLQGKATAYVCLNYKCELPTTDPEKMLSLLGIKSSN